MAYVDIVTALALLQFIRIPGRRFGFKVDTRARSTRYALGVIYLIGRQVAGHHRQRR
jgi:hypothetical protein